MGIYSPKFGLVFVHVPRTGGTSIKAAISSADAGAVELAQHAKPSEIVEAIGFDAWASSYKFAVVRNPWDRAVSIYNYISQHVGHPDHERTSAMTWEEYLVGVHIRLSRDRQHHWTHIGGRLVLDEVCRFESLADHVGAVLDGVGIPATLPHVNGSRHEMYADCFSALTSEQLAASRREELRLFGFEFCRDGASAVSA